MSANHEFETTHWSLIVSSRLEDTDVRQASLSELCEAYWYPLFAYLRRKGHGPEESADYVQGFFVELIDKDFLESVSPEKGRFRWFMMSAIKRFVSNLLEKKHALKRGGGVNRFSVDINDAERKYQLEPVDGWSAEKLFDRQWALAVLKQALDELETEQTSRGKLELYKALQPTLSGIPMTMEQYAEIGEQFSIPSGAVKVAALRLRQKYRDSIREIVAQTLTDSQNVGEELNELLSALRG
ncbi:MAG: RNA polymerase sigma factor (sigma-70 family) [Mariniblastus sp.]|jgi:RNA polymerase sigma factor (sigma-70 family)